VLLRLVILAVAVLGGVIALRMWRGTPRIARLELPSLGVTGPAIVQFGTQHCAPCKQSRPLLRRTAEETGVQFVDVDLEERPDLATRYRIRSVPVVVVASSEGTVLGRWTGVPPDREVLRLAELAKAA
jgi:thioredoxin-like negative regulator of GroEL